MGLQPDRWAKGVWNNAIEAAARVADNETGPAAKTIAANIRALKQP